MVSKSTIVLIQCIIVLVCILVNTGLQTAAYSALGRSGVETIEDISSARKTLLWSIILHYITTFFLILATVLLLVHKFSNTDRYKLVNEYNSIIVYGILGISCFLLLLTGAVGSNVAVKLQCYKANESINYAWKMATSSGVIGVLGTIFILLIQIFMHKDHINKSLLQRKENIVSKEVDNLNINPPAAYLNINIE
jgi:hypothetical protein